MTGYGRRAAGSADRLADAELQADVMRFVAILALCLVGISTLVDRASVAATEPAAPMADTSAAARTPSPLTDAPARPDLSRPDSPPNSPPNSPPDSPHKVDRDGTVPAFDVEKPEPRVDSLPAKAQPPAGIPGSTPQDKPEEVDPTPSSSFPIGLPVVDGAGSNSSLEETLPEETPSEQAPAPSPGAERGLVLRFESDAALLRMVGRGEAGVFVLAGREVFALDISRGVTFRPAPSPARMRIITPDTVPALLRAEYRGPAGATWGVTLPGATLDAMRPFVERGEAGVLVISADGSVRLETDDV